MRLNRSRRCWRHRRDLLTLISLLSALSAVPDDVARSEPAVIAIIIDDLGYRATEGKRAVRLPGPVACAILPNTPHAVDLARLAHAEGKEVLLHQPLQSVEVSPAAEPGAIRLDTPRLELVRIIRDNIAAVPHVVGISTHMGSLLTRHPGHMEWLMQEIRQHPGLFFVDSRTTAASVALQLARENGVPATGRQIFLDRDPDPAAVAREFQELKVLALRRGSAVAIGHPYDVTLSLLERELPSLGDELRLVPVVNLIELRPAESTPR